MALEQSRTRSIRNVQAPATQVNAETPQRAYFIGRDAGLHMPAILLLGSLLGLLCYNGLIRTTFGGFDEARHMMNAVFFADFYRDLPVTRLADYAIEYFIRFPALSFSWHPPMFPALAGIFVLFGGLEPVLVRFLVFAFSILG